MGTRVKIPSQRKNVVAKYMQIVILSDVAFSVLPIVRFLYNEDCYGRSQPASQQASSSCLKNIKKYTCV